MLFRREGCHLCEAVEAELLSMKLTGRVTVVNVDADPAIQARYILRIPVVAVGGEEAFDGKMMDREGRWKELLRSRLSGLTQVG
ncbi:MAG: glutaredoxin family protein [Nitrososphaerota archaeon]|jgi:hypothetical protein|nr:glutaredoxin family protein [Nitrososphaerota archaeon]MDG6950956.1 glutaredoxin family protein [Nitrososphaerota archaeon]